MTVSSMGEMSSNVVADATRSPPIQCLVSISTPSTVAVVILVRLVRSSVCQYDTG